MSNLLIDEPPVQVLPTLAKKIGLNEAIVTQQLYWLLNFAKGGRVVDGQRWIYNTYEEWHEKFFPFWSPRTMARIFDNLETMQIVISAQFDGRESRRKYYRLNEGMVKLMKDGKIPDPANLAASADDDKLAAWEQDNMAGSEHDKLAGSLSTVRLRIDSSETPGFFLSSEPVKKAGRAGNGAVQIPVSLQAVPEFGDAWKSFVQHRKGIKKPLTPRTIGMVLKRLSERPHQAVIALDMVTEKGWSSFHWDWVDKELAKRSSGNNGHSNGNGHIEPLRRLKTPAERDAEQEARFADQLRK